MNCQHFISLLVKFVGLHKNAVSLLVNLLKEYIMVFWERFCELCAEKGITPTQMVRDAGIAAGSVTKWKNGSIPHGVTRKKIADYFNISEKELFEASESKEKKPAAISDELWDMIQNDPKAIALLEMVLKMSPEQRDKFEKFLEGI